MTSPGDEAAIRAVLDRQVAAWGAGDAEAFAADARADVVFTNVVGMFSVGRAAFVAQHARIFSTFYKGTTMTQTVEAQTFVRPDVAVVNTLTGLEGVVALPPGFPHAAGPLKSRLEQVMVREGDGWRVAAFHNVLVTPLADGPPPGR